MKDFKTAVAVGFTRLAYHYLSWLSIAWYSLTMRLTKHHKASVPVYKDYKTIVEDMGWGFLYRRDPLNGKFDYLTHPTRLAYNVDNRTGFGDCDDHAIYWCTAIKKSNLADKVWFCFYSMVREKTLKLSGHAVCVFYKADEDQYYWCDYGLPNTIEKKEYWPIESAEKYDSSAFVATMCEVIELKDDDTPIFGETVVFNVS